MPYIITGVTGDCDCVYLNRQSHQRLMLTTGSGLLRYFLHATREPVFLNL